MIQKKIHKSILSVDLSGELSQLEEFFSEKFNHNGLMAIVGTHQYEFDLNLSSRMLNYYESNGWKIGGRSPMKNWKAAANNWMLNAEKFNPKVQTSNLHLNQEKDYDIPL